MNSPPHTTRNLTMALLLAAATIACYWPVLDHQFLNYDDDLYIVNNEVVKHGLTTQGITWAFTTFHAGNWHPLTWLSHMLDCTILGVEPGSHLMMNVLMHAANAVLLLWLLVRMTGAFWRSYLVAALFALHPLHVESVAWVAERKDVLSTLLGLLCLHAYAGYARSPSVARYVLVAIWLALGLMAKPMLVTLPFVMLLLDVWPLRRMNIAAAQLVNAHNSGSPARLVMEKVPLILLAAASSIVTIIAQSGSRAVWSVEAMSLSQRLANASVAYVQYLRQTFWPTDLAVVYPVQQDWPPGLVTGSLVLLVAVTITCLMMVRTRPWFLVGWLWFVGTLIPVIGIMQVGAQSRADRYTYIPLIGVFIMLAWSVPAITNPRREPLKFATYAGLGAAVLALAVCTRVQLSYWRDSIALFTHALNVTTRNSIAHGNLAAALMNADPPLLAGAIEHNRAALAIWPEHATAAKNLGRALAGSGQLDEAIKWLTRAIEIRPDYAEAWSDLGAVHAQFGQVNDAANCYRRAIEIDPDLIEPQVNLGSLLAAGEQANEAVRILQRAVEMQPNNASAHFHLGVATSRLNQPDRAMEAFRAATAIRPDYLEAWINLGNMLVNLGRLDQAITAYERALSLDSRNDMALNGMARALSRKGLHAQAVDYARRVLAVHPDNPTLLINLSGLLLDANDPAAGTAQEALQLASRAAELTERRDAKALGALARAQAANGDLASAIAALRTAIPLAQLAGQPALADDLQKRLDAYLTQSLNPNRIP